MGENADFLRRAFEAWNEGDPYVFLGAYDPDVELFIPTGSFPEEGLYRGHDVVNRWHAQNYAPWGESKHVDVGRIEEIGNVAIVELRMSGAGKRSGVPIESDVIMIVGFRDDKLAYMSYDVGADRTAAPQESEPG